MEGEGLRSTRFLRHECYKFTWGIGRRKTATDRAQGFGLRGSLLGPYQEDVPMMLIANNNEENA